MDAEANVGSHVSSSSFSVNNFDLNSSPPLIDEEIADTGGDHEISNCSSFSTNMIHTHTGLDIIPDVSVEFKPVIGTVFKTFNDAEAYYKIYSSKAGFSTRLSTIKRNKNVITNRYILCNRAGKPKNKDVDSLEPIDPNSKTRRSYFSVTNCKARIGLKQLPSSESYVLVSFNENNNHVLFDDSNKQLSRSNRQLKQSDREFIHRVSKSNIGHTKAHRLNSLMKGGYSNLYGTVADYKNFRRDLNKYIGNRDAQMLVDKLNLKKFHVPNYSFEYQVIDSELTCAFWADETSKINFQLFGDVISFDGTYETNMYNMVFVPFTGVDNNRRCITFGAGLLKNETIEFYKWLLEAFLKTHSKQPQLVLTDQDPALMQVVLAMFTDSTHRLCMWHIMKKLPVKVSTDLLQNTDIRKHLHKLVWNVYLTPVQFEEKWTSLIKEFSLEDNNWLSDMFEVKELWIPGYFKDIPLCCLMKNTSLSESENSFFSIYSAPGNTLIQFMTCFETAMEKQRYDQIIFYNQTSTVVPKWSTRLAIERDASVLYTIATFNLVQKEISRGVWQCIQKSSTVIDGVETSVILHKNKHGDIVAEFKVTFKLDDHSYSCNCEHYMRHGYPCRHLFYVWSTKSVKMIPKEFILKRWRRDLFPSELRLSRLKYGPSNYENEQLSVEASNIVYSCVHLLRSDTQKFNVFVEKLRILKKEVEDDVPAGLEPKSKEDVMKELLGVEPPEKVSINAPEGIRNKGSRKKKRLVGAAEKAIKIAKKSKKAQKPKTLRIGTYRLCGYCGEVVNDHDKRNCLKKQPPPKKDNNIEKDDFLVDEEEADIDEDFDSTEDSGDDQAASSGTDDSLNNVDEEDDSDDLFTP